MITILPALPSPGMRSQGGEITRPPGMEIPRPPVEMPRSVNNLTRSRSSSGQTNEVQIMDEFLNFRQ